ncbi:MAG: hypothetical protein ACI388_07980 [Methanobrevibacter sp.]|uniref:hypothetical protein n=1 Tax=Methanobrevibacter sp. TaxID=66852 RepID=UPI002A6072BE|nr:hypothetical protein [Turicibacter sp.]
MEKYSLKLGRFYKDDKILQHEEVMNLRYDLTKFKLVMLEIIEDLENGKGNDKYVEWIKENVDVTLG